MNASDDENCPYLNKKSNEDQVNNPDQSQINKPEEPEQAEVPKEPEAKEKSQKPPKEPKIIDQTVMNNQDDIDSHLYSDIQSQMSI